MGFTVGCARAAASRLRPAVAGCQPLYGGKPEHLKNPEKKRKPPERRVAAVPVKYVEDCTASFGDDPKKVARREPAMSRQHVDAGDTALSSAEKAKDDQRRRSA